MLDKTQSAVVQSTVVNACHLTCAIASKVLGVTITDTIHGQSVTRNAINKIVIEEIKKTHFKEV